jgi:Domain of unknown function (DUF4879)
LFNSHVNLKNRNKELIMDTRNLVLILTIAAFTTGCLSADTTDTENDTQPGIESTHSDQTNNLRLPKLSEFSTKYLNHAEGKMQGDALGPPPGPAPGVSYFQTYAVASSNSGLNWEFVSASQFTTNIDHGGTLLSVAVYTFGYGNGGASLSGLTGVHWGSDAVCGTFSTAHFCSIGETVTGFIDYYSFDGSQGGGFSAFTNSIAFPFGQWTDSITVR